MRLHKKGQSVCLTLYIKQFLLLLFVLLYLGKENGNLMCIFPSLFINLIICYYVIRPFKLQIFFMHLTNIQYSKFSSSEPLAKVLSLLQFTSRLVSDSVLALFVHILSNQGQKFNYNFKVIL